MDVAALRQLIKDAAQQKSVVFTKCLDDKASSRYKALVSERTAIATSKTDKKSAGARSMEELDELVNQARAEVESNTIKLFFAPKSPEQWASANADMVRLQLRAATGGKEYKLEVEAIFAASVKALEMTFDHAEFAGEFVELGWEEVKPLMNSADIDEVYFNVQNMQRNHGISDNPLR